MTTPIAASEGKESARRSTVAGSADSPQMSYTKKNIKTVSASAKRAPLGSGERTYDRLRDE